MSERLTDLRIKSVTPPPGKPQLDIADTDVAGLTLRVTSQGVKTFTFRFRDADGKMQRTTIGRYPDIVLKDARIRASELRVQIAKGDNPAAKRKKEKVQTVAVLCEEFLSKHAIHNRRGDETRRILELDLLPRFGTRDYTTIKRAEIIKLIDDLEHGTHTRIRPSEKARRDKAGPKPGQARNTLAAVRKMFNWAVSRDLLEVSPCAGVRCGAPPAKRSRRLDDNELQAILQALPVLEWPFRPIVRLLILTAQRREQIAALRWSWINFDRREIAFPASIMKNKREHTLPMSEAIERELRALPHMDDDDRVFPSRTKASSGHASGFSKSKRRLDAKSGVTDWRLHDLRRTARSGMARLRVPSRVAETVLSHVIPGVEGVYDRHEYHDEMREALELWSRHVDTLHSTPNSIRN